MSWLLPPVEGRAYVAPSLLAADFAALDRDIARMTIAGSDLLHLDVMDGHFVPNLTFGPLLVQAAQRLTDLPLDVHLMLSNPDRFVTPFIQAGADCLTIHVECDADIEQTLQAIKSQGARCGISLKPPTSLEDIKPFLGQVDLVLVMTVRPGFGGQTFDHSCLNKIADLKKMRAAGAGDFLISVDGGINAETGQECRQAGADILVSGSWLFHADDLQVSVSTLSGENSS